MGCAHVGAKAASAERRVPLAPASGCGLAGSPAALPAPPCFRCGGKGFRHEGTLDHDGHSGERCFGCENCQLCRGSGRLEPPHRGGPRPCSSCSGRGFRHASAMRHDGAADQRCLFCAPCGDCAGQGAAPCGMPAARARGADGAEACDSSSQPPCFRCAGRGFRHESRMDHDAPADEKCFWCKSCQMCGGTGSITLGGASACAICGGTGFCHWSRIGHSKARDVKCMWCKDCVACGGKGVVLQGWGSEMRVDLPQGGPQPSYVFSGQGSE
uniref:Uncharacterized protein n=1 Tax=Zooxanthella nutricula TaxID=1333877 RepID=A0A7S2K7C0_9DINO